MSTIATGGLRVEVGRGTTSESGVRRRGETNKLRGLKTHGERNRERRPVFLLKCGEEQEASHSKAVAGNGSTLGPLESERSHN